MMQQNLLKIEMLNSLPTLQTSYLLMLMFLIKKYKNSPAQDLESWKQIQHKIDVSFHKNVLEMPLHWKKPQMIFVNSMSDTFHEKVNSNCT